MSERSGGEKINDAEARALLSIMFAERVGDAARALKLYGNSLTVGAEAEIKMLKNERDMYLAEVRRLSDLFANIRVEAGAGERK